MTGSVPMKDERIFCCPSDKFKDFLAVCFYDCEKVGQIPQMCEKPFTLHHLTLGKFGEKMGHEVAVRTHPM
jgi:hypothetical protein